MFRRVSGPHCVAYLHFRDFENMFNSTNKLNYYSSLPFNKMLILKTLTYSTLSTIL